MAANNTDVEKLINMLYEMINDAKNMPRSGDKCIVDRDAALAAGSPRRDS